MLNKKTISKENYVASTIHIIDSVLRTAMHQIDAKKCSSDYFTMSGDTVEKLINKYKNRAAKSALVIDDLGLQVINRLLQEGFKDITLVLCRIPDEFFDLTVAILSRTFPDIVSKINIISLKELDKMDVDLVIANPPYGKIGADITDKIRKTINYKEFVNLLPANDYKRGASKETFKYARDMEPLNNAFEGDAAVITHLCKIVKESNNSTIEDFEISQYLDASLIKYFSENINREHYALDCDSFSTKCKNNLFNPNTTFILGWRDVNHHALPKSKTSTTYLWNVEKSIDCNYVWSKHKNKNNTVWFYNIVFNSSVEKDNFVKFMYLDPDGSAFCSKLWTSMNLDGTASWEKWFPKVDWTRSWTVEEILVDYGYTEEEIKEVMDDLVNFKGMED